MEPLDLQTLPSRQDYNEAIFHFKRQLESIPNADAFLYGGFLRDMDLGLTPKDVDVVLRITPEEWQDLKMMFAPYVDRSLSAFGMEGISKHINGIKFDIWPLYNYKFSETGPFISTVLDHTDLSCNEILQHVTRYLELGTHLAIKSVQYLKGKEERMFWETNPIWPVSDEKIQRLSEKLNYGYKPNE